MNLAQKRIEIIERSLRCFALGWCSFVPVAGPILLVLVWRHFLLVNREGEGAWNPARKYLTWGLVLATLGCLETIILAGLIVAAVIHASTGSLDE